MGGRVVHAHTRVRAGRARGPRAADHAVSRWVRVSAAVALGALAVAAAGTSLVLALGRPDPGPRAQGGLVLPGLSARARILRDPFRLPALGAENLARAYRPLCF